MLETRPDLAYAVSTLGRFNADPSCTHAGAVKRTLRYLRRTQQHGLIYGGFDRGLIGYCDSDWASNPDTRRSTTGYVFILAGAAISWKSRQQPIVARLSTEAECVLCYGHLCCVMGTFMSTPIAQGCLMKHCHFPLPTSYQNIVSLYM